VSNVAHELRTPLTNIRGYLEALTDGVLPPSKELFQSLQEETLLLTRVVESLFDLAEANASARRLSLRRESLAAIVDRAAASCRQQSDAKHIIVETSLEAGTEEIVGDAHCLVQVIRNLLQNAIEHTAAGGQVQVLSFDQPHAIQVVVADDGPGIHEADLPFVFDRFFRGRNASPPSAKGAGLGLAIVKELVNAHGGRTGADASDRGARVWFTLPKRP